MRQNDRAWRHNRLTGSAVDENRGRYKCTEKIMIDTDRDGYKDLKGLHCERVPLRSAAKQSDD